MTDTVGISLISNQRRLGPRIPLGLPAKVRWKSRGGGYQQATGWTQNISGNGFFVALPRRVRRDTPILVTMILPAVVTKVPIELHCQGRVTRWNQPGEECGLGAVIDDYELRLRPRRV